MSCSPFRGGTRNPTGQNCRAPRHPHTTRTPWGGGARASHLTPGYQARQTSGLPSTIPPPEVAEYPNRGRTNAQTIP
ncbi:MAG: hypothetical protein IKN99_04945 [Bacteroidales bacterium]|nr:hypothetical protein [Bacteroidales bacterium]